MFLGNGVLKICSKFTGEHPCRSAISINLLCNFIEIALRHGSAPVNFLYKFRTPFSKNTSGWLLPSENLALSGKIISPVRGDKTDQVESSHRKCSVKKVFLEISQNS